MAGQAERNEDAMASADPLQLYNVADAARLLGLGKSKTWELVLRGDLGSLKIDGSRRVPRAAVDAYIKRLSAEAGSTIPA